MANALVTLLDGPLAEQEFVIPALHGPPPMIAIGRDDLRVVSELQLGLALRILKESGTEADAQRLSSTLVFYKPAPSLDEHLNPVLRYDSDGRVCYEWVRLEL